MSKLDLVKKYIKFEEFSKAINIAFENIKSISFLEQKEMIDYLLDNVLIPMRNDSVIQELGDLIIDMPELSEYYLNKKSNYKLEDIASIEIDSKTVEMINNVFIKLDFLDSGNKNLDELHVDLNKSQNLMYREYSELKLSIIKKLNEEFFNIQNRKEIENIIYTLTSNLDDKLQKCKNEMSIFNIFYDEIIFDLELIIKSFIFSQNILAKKMLEIYDLNAIPCGWKGLYPEGKIIYVSNI